MLGLSIQYSYKAININVMKKKRNLPNLHIKLSVGDPVILATQEKKIRKITI
jgi:hypothetical protein